MYPDNALAEFYPSWLINEANSCCVTLTEIHAFASPIMQAMDYSDKGRDWCDSNGLLAQARRNQMDNRHLPIGPAACRE